MRLLILGQIDADQTVPSEQKLRQRTAHRGLADTGRTGEQQRCLRPSAVAQSGGAPPDRPADACDRLPLSDHRLREHRLHLQHPRAVSLRQLMISLAALCGRRHICGDNLPAPLQMHRRAGLVQQVDRLVRQKPLRTDAHGQPNRLLRHARTQRDPMMGLIPRRDALQNAQCGLLVRLAHVDALKPPVERGVLLNRLVVFLHRRRPDQPDFSARKCRLEQIGGVNRPLRRTRTHQRVYLVDKRNHALVRAQLAHNAAQTLLKLAAVLGSRDQRRHVDGQDTRVFQLLRHIAVRNRLCQRLGNRSLAHTGIPQQDGVVLSAPRQNGQHAEYLVVPSDHRIELSAPRKLGQIHRILVQYRCPRPAAHQPRLALRQGLDAGQPLERHHVRPHLLHHLPRHTSPALQNRPEQRLGSDTALRRFPCLFNHLTQMRRHLGRIGVRIASSVVLRQPPLEQALGHARRGEDAPRHAPPLPQETQKQIFRPDLLPSHLSGCLFRTSHRPSRRLVKSLILIHGHSLAFVKNSSSVNANLYRFFRVFHRNPSSLTAFPSLPIFTRRFLLKILLKWSCFFFLLW